MGLNRALAEKPGWSFALAVGFVLAGGLVLLACDTPVYRYAMYRWQPAPYELYYFHTEPAGEQDQAIHKSLNSMARSRTTRPNVVLLPVDLREDEELVGVPPDVKQAWTTRKDQSTPQYMLVSPLGMQIHAGAIDKGQVEQLIDSPARRRMAKMLQQANAAVFVMLASGDAKADAKAEEELENLRAEVAEGKLNLYAGPADQFAPADEGADQQQPPAHQVAYLKVARDDADEQWFIRQLMAVEPDLYDFQDQPMVFAAYGRGRVLPPYIGKGINRDNLVECVAFLTGACSCTVKEQNPGVDLLVSYDWEAAAAAVAEKFGSEEGNENQYGVESFFPDLFAGEQPAPVEDRADSADATSEEEAGSPGERPESTVAAETGVAENRKVDATQSTVQASSTNTRSADATDPGTATEAGAAVVDSAADSESPSPNDSGAESPDTSATASSEQAEDGSVALVAEPDPESGGAEAAEESLSGEAASTAMLLTIGLGIGLVLFLLIGATFILFRPQ